MNKSDLILLLAHREKLTEKQAKEIIDIVFDGFTNTLKANGRIEIRGFVSFFVRKYGSYKGRNPKSGKGITVKPKRLPFFKVGKELKERINKA